MNPIGTGTLPLRPRGSALAITLGVPLWLTTLACLCYVTAQWMKVVVVLLLGAVAGMFGHSPSLGSEPRIECLLVSLLAAAVSGMLCGLAYCVPAVRALPGSHQFAVLGAVALLAPLAATVWTVLTAA